MSLFKSNVDLEAGARRDMQQINHEMIELSIQRKRDESSSESEYSRNDSVIEMASIREMAKRNRKKRFNYSFDSSKTKRQNMIDGRYNEEKKKERIKYKEIKKKV